MDELVAAFVGLVETLPTLVSIGHFSPSPIISLEALAVVTVLSLLLFNFISFAIPKYNNYNNYNYYHKAYIHKLTTHLSTRAIPQLPHKVMPTVILQMLFKKEETNHFF